MTPPGKAGAREKRLQPDGSIAIVAAAPSDKPSASEAPTVSFAVSHGEAGVTVWNPTERLSESTVSEDGSGGCHLCGLSITGEEARYYTHAEQAATRVAGSSQKPLTVASMNYEVRGHFLVHHMRSIPATAAAVEVVVAPMATTPSAPDYDRILREAEEMQVHVLFLERELAFSRNALDKMYRVISNMPATARKKEPYKSDVKVTCHKCEGKTFWRSGSGRGECYPTCPEPKTETAYSREVRKRSDDAAWAVLFDETEE